MISKKLFFLATLLFLSSVIHAQNIVKWKFSLKDKGNGEIELIADAVIQRGWHLYDTDIPEDGPFPATLSIETIKGAQPIGKFHAIEKKPTVKFDPIFGMEVRFFENTAKFAQRLKITNKNAFLLIGDIRAQACDNKSCTPPLPVDFSFKSADLPATVVPASAKVKKR